MILRHRAESTADSASPKVKAQEDSREPCPRQWSPPGHSPGVEPLRQASPAGNPRTAVPRRAPGSSARPSFPAEPPTSSSATPIAARLPALPRRTPRRAEVRKTIKKSRGKRTPPPPAAPEPASR